MQPNCITNNVYGMKSKCKNPFGNDGWEIGMCVDNALIKCKLFSYIKMSLPATHPINLDFVFIKLLCSLVIHF